jgi:hypothetical protein
MGSFFSPTVMRRIAIALWVVAAVLVAAIAWRLLAGW